MNPDIHFPILWGWASIFHSLFPDPRFYFPSPLLPFPVPNKGFQIPDSPREYPFILGFPSSRGWPGPGVRDPYQPKFQLSSLFSIVRRLELHSHQGRNLKTTNFLTGFARAGILRQQSSSIVVFHLKMCVKKRTTIGIQFFFTIYNTMDISFKSTNSGISNVFSYRKEHEM